MSKAEPPEGFEMKKFKFFDKTYHFVTSFKDGDYNYYVLKFWLKSKKHWEYEVKADYILDEVWGLDSSKFGGETKNA